MKRRTFLKMMAALGAVPSLGMLKPAPQEFGNTTYISDGFYLQPAEAGRQFAEYVRENRKWIDREIIRACGLPHLPGDQRGER